MFEKELKEEERTLNNLSSNVRKVISRYESELKDLQKQFDKIEGSAEKEIEADLQRLKDELDKLCKDIEKETESNLKESKKSIDKQEESALSKISDYQDRCKEQFDQIALSMRIVKGEL